TRRPPRSPPFPYTTLFRSHRELGHDRQTDRLALERHPRTAGPGEPERAAVGCADRRADGADLVLGLERLDRVVLEFRQLVQDVRSEEHTSELQVTSGYRMP